MHPFAVNVTMYVVVVEGVASGVGLFGLSNPVDGFQTHVNVVVVPQVNCVLVPLQMVAAWLILTTG